jgi:hypothetical protein
VLPFGWVNQFAVTRKLSGVFVRFRAHLAGNWISLTTLRPET